MLEKLVKTIKDLAGEGNVIALLLVLAGGGLLVLNQHEAGMMTVGGALALLKGDHPQTKA